MTAAAAPLRLLGYVRVSRDDQQRDGHSVHQQPERLRAWCAAYGYTLVDVIVEPSDVSGRKPLEKREGGAQLLRRLRAGEADGLVVIRLERIFRDMLDGLHFFRHVVRPRGLVVCSLAEHIDTSTANGRMACNLLLLLADHEADKAGERTKEVMDGLRERGRVYGSVPYGCIAIDGALYRDPTGWPLREQVVELATAPGDDGRRPSLSAAAAAIFARRIAAPDGGARWAKNSVKRVRDTHDGLKHLTWAPRNPEPHVSSEVNPE